MVVILLVIGCLINDIVPGIVRLTLLNRCKVTAFSAYTQVFPYAAQHKSTKSTEYTFGFQRLTLKYIQKKVRT